MGLAINKTVDYDKKHLVWSINPEGLRFYAYLFFHIAPFTCLIFALSLLSIKNYIYYR